MELTSRGILLTPESVLILPCVLCLMLGESGFMNSFRIRDLFFLMGRRMG